MYKVTELFTLKSKNKRTYAHQTQPDTGVAAGYFGVGKRLYLCNEIRSLQA